MKTYVLVGTGGRGTFMYAEAIVQRYQDAAKLVGLMDVNLRRAAYVAKRLAQPDQPPIPIFSDFAEMVRQVKPQCAIITTVDQFHDRYIAAALDMGLEVISEKPMTTDASKCRAILAAEKRNARGITVTFNCRFMPLFAKLKEMLRAGAVGTVLNVDFEWMLDTSHGADYFRRWHRYMANSGGLLVHKATHHFDIINWLIEQEPESVFANGSLRFYGPSREQRGERCSTCPHTGTCAYVFRDAQIDWVRDMYFGCEGEDGYYRDRCVFAPDIDIYDTMSLAVRYRKGALMSYSLVAHSPYEGWRMSITGTEGRLEASEFSTGPLARDAVHRIDVFNRKQERLTVELAKESGSHGGGDERLLRMLFRNDLADPLGQYAGSRDGAMSILIGIAANQSIREKRLVTIAELVPDADFEKTTEV